MISDMRSDPSLSRCNLHLCNDDAPSVTPLILTDAPQHVQRVSVGQLPAISGYSIKALTHCNNFCEKIFVKNCCLSAHRTVKKSSQLCKIVVVCMDYCNYMHMVWMIPTFSCCFSCGVQGPSAVQDGYPINSINFS